MHFFSYLYYLVGVESSLFNHLCETVDHQWCRDVLTFYIAFGAYIFILQSTCHYDTT